MATYNKTKKPGHGQNCISSFTKEILKGERAQADAQLSLDCKVVEKQCADTTQ